MGQAQQVIDDVLQPEHIANLPAFPRITRFEWRQVVDSSHEEALDITGVVEGEPTVHEMVGALFPVFDAVLNALSGAGIDLYPHVRLLSEASLADQAAYLTEYLSDEADAE